MKNKKLYAILTLVAFMMTLMPVMAFAATSTLTVTTATVTDNASDKSKSDIAVVITSDDSTATDEVTVKLDGVAQSAKITLAGGTGNATYTVDKDATAKTIKVTAEAIVSGTTVTSAEKDATVPAAPVNGAVTAPVDVTILAGDSSATVTTAAATGVVGDLTAAVTTGTAGDLTLTVKGDKTVQIDATKELVASTEYEITLTAAGVNGGSDAKATFKVNVVAPTPTTKVSHTHSRISIDGDESVTIPSTGNAELKFDIVLRDATNSPVNAGANDVLIWAERANGVVSDVDTLTFSSGATPVGQTGAYIVSGNNVKLTVASTTPGVVTIKGAVITDESVATISDVKAVLKGDKGNKFSKTAEGTFEAKSGKNTIKDVTWSSNNTTAKANGVDVVKMTGYLYNSSNVEVAKETIRISADKAGITFPTNVTTDANGKFTIEFTATKSGDYEIRLNASGTTEYVTGATGNAPKVSFVGSGAFNVVLDDAPDALVSDIEGATIDYKLVDINGNVQTDSTSVNSLKFKHYVDGKEVSAGSGVLSGDIVKYTSKSTKIGNHKVTAYLPNGKSVVTEYQVKEQGDLVKMTIDYKVDTVALNSTTNEPKVKYYDAEGVSSTENSVTSNVVFTKVGPGTISTAGAVSGSNDKDNIGKEINVTAVNKTNKLVATATIKVAAPADRLSFGDAASLKAGETATVVAKLVNGQGDVVRVTGSAEPTVSVNYVVTEKPEDAIVTISVGKVKLVENGTIEFDVTCNKAGAVKATVVLTVGTGVDAKSYAGELVADSEAAKKPVDNTVVMMTGQKMIVVDGNPVMSPVAPFVQDNRTFLPMRALAEAIGAEIAWDQATQTVTLTAGDVVTTFVYGGSVVTVNGEATDMGVKVMAVDQYTVLPVRFAAEAIGYEVEYTTDANGVTTVTLTK